MKYIIIDGVFPVTFSEGLRHKDFEYLPGKITSAGKCRIRNNQVTCYGESVTLRLKPGERDAEIIKMNLLEIHFSEEL